MKFIGVREAQQQLSGLVEQAQEERIVLTRHGQPVAVMTGIEGKDLEEVLLAQDPAFRKLITERRRAGAQLVSHEAVVAKAKREAGRKVRPKARRRRKAS